MKYLKAVWLLCSYAVGQGLTRAGKAEWGNGLEEYIGIK